uniref:Uncharacterized protein n=1 Tax=viral metagenome TaxID=1070528 RepID=A0A6C0DUW9_9ZZZZ
MSWDIQMWQNIPGTIFLLEEKRFGHLFYELWKYLFPDSEVCAEIAFAISGSYLGIE